MDPAELEIARKNGLVLDGREAAGVWLRGPDGKEILVNQLPCIVYEDGEYALDPMREHAAEIMLQLLGIRHRALETQQRDLDAAITQNAALVAKLREQSASLEASAALVGQLKAAAHHPYLGTKVRTTLAAILGGVVKRLENGHVRGPDRNT